MNALAACRPQVENLVARILRRRKDDADVQDCTNETLRRALETPDRTPAGDVQLPWLLGIARHVALDSLRAEYRRRARTVREAPETADGTSSRDPISRLPDDSLDPESAAGQRQDLRRLGEALRGLPGQQREVLLALHVEGLGYREIAERMGVPVGTIGTWVLRARQSLQEALPESGRSRTREEL